MVDEVISFLSSQKTTSIKTVHLVIFMSDTYQAFQQALSSEGSCISGPTYDSTPSPNPQHMSQPLPRRRKYRLVGSRPSTKPTSETSASNSFTIGDLKVRIIKGDISDDDSDVIVNPTNAKM